MLNKFVDAMGYLGERIRWGHARRWGEHPSCSRCDRDARYILRPQDEPRCLLHSDKDYACQICVMKELDPEDYFR